LENKAEKHVLKGIKGYGKAYVDDLTDEMEKDEKVEKIKELQEVYYANKSDCLSRTRERAFKDRRTVLQRQVQDNITSLIGVLNRHTKIIEDVSNRIKMVLNVDNLYNNAGADIPSLEDMPNYENIQLSDTSEIASREFQKILENEDLMKSLNKLRYIYINMVSNYNFIHKTRSIVDHLKLCRNKTIQYTENPKTFDIKKKIKDDIDKIIDDMKGDK